MASTSSARYSSVLHVLVGAAVVLPILAAFSGAPEGRADRLLAAGPTSAGFAAVWVAFIALERQRQDSAAQAEHVVRVANASEESARAARTLADAAVARDRAERVARLRRVAAVCDGVAQRIEAVCNSGLMRHARGAAFGGAGFGGADPPDRAESVSLPKELWSCARTLPTIHGDLGVLDARAAPQLAAAGPALEAAADRLERATPIGDANWSGVGERAVDVELIRVLSDLRNVAGAARAAAEAELQTSQVAGAQQQLPGA